MSCWVCTFRAAQRSESTELRRADFAEFGEIMLSAISSLQRTRTAVMNCARAWKTEWCEETSGGVDFLRFAGSLQKVGTASLLVQRTTADKFYFEDNIKFDADNVYFLRFPTYPKSKK